jgi:minor extracellular serine protease Vpr
MSVRFLKTFLKLKKATDCSVHSSAFSMNQGVAHRDGVVSPLFQPALLIGLAVFAAHVASAQPAVVPGGVLNAASFAKNASGQGTPVAPGSLVSIFGTSLGTTQADADTVPFSTSLGGVSVTFNGISAPLRDVVPASQLVNAQIPFEVLAAGQTSGTVNVVVTVGTVQTPPQTVSIVAQAPGVFTIPPGVGNVVMADITKGFIVGPVGVNLGLGPMQPIPRGDFAYFYATGLGAFMPSGNNAPVADGGVGVPGVTYNAVNMPQVTIGGIQAQVLFAGQAPGFPGVYQVNIQIPQGAPTGDGIAVRMISADGTQTSPDKVATISVQ